MFLGAFLLKWEIADFEHISDIDQFTGVGIKGIRWSSGFGTCVNIPFNYQNTIQIRFDIDGTKNVTGVYIRGWHNENGWQEWKTIATF